MIERSNLSATDNLTIYAQARKPFTGTLDALVLLHAAERATGLSLWGSTHRREESFRADFTSLCASLEGQAMLTSRGRDRAHSRLHVMLCSRLRSIDWRVNHPATANDVIAAPLIGTGLPRAGTTFLHNLLAQDPACRSAQAWEAALPVPPPEPETYATDPRRAIYRDIMAYQGFADASLTEIHPFGADLPEECIFLQEGHCGALYSAFFNVPDFAARVHGDAAGAYQWQIEQMHLLQSRMPAGRWALKAPGHLFSWADMLIAFPDARITINHRDPAKVIPSIASLFMGLRRSFSDVGSDPVSVAHQQLNAWSQAVGGLMDWRSAHEDEVKIVDVHYLDLIAAPIETVRRIYDAFDITLSRQAHDRIEEFADSSRSLTRHGRRYGLADYGLTEAAIETAFASYIDHYGIVREPRW